MSRIDTIRRQVANSYYHVYHRGINGQLVFLQAKDYAYFKKVVSESAQATTGITILDHAFLPNHFHLIFHQETIDGVSRCMHRLLIRYTRYFNEKYDRLGPIFEGRYRSIFLPKLSDVERTKRYIRFNPKQAGLRNWPYVSQKRRTRKTLQQTSDELYSTNSR